MTSVGADWSAFGWVTEVARKRARALFVATPAWVREILLVGVIYGAYELARGLVNQDLPAAMANSVSILHWEQAWHLDPERALNAALHHLPVLAVAASYFYSTLHYLVTPAVLVWMFRRHGAQYAFARTSLAISTVVALIGYTTLPTAPPRMLAGSGLHDTLADVHQWGWWGGEGSVPRGLGGLSDQFAAMPSLHFGWSLWCGVLIALYARRRWDRVLGVAYPVLTALVVMSTGNHYLLDVVAGAAVMGIGVIGARVLQAAKINSGLVRRQGLEPRTR